MGHFQPKHIELGQLSLSVKIRCTIEDNIKLEYGVRESSSNNVTIEIFVGIH